MLCDCLVSVGASAGEMWSEVASSLTHYLTHHPQQLPHLLVCLLPISVWSPPFPPLQLPFSAVLQEVHRGDWSSCQRQSFQSSVLPSLLDQLWSLRDSSSLWLAYRLARRASAKASLISSLTGQLSSPLTGLPRAGPATVPETVRESDSGQIPPLVDWSSPLLLLTAPPLLLPQHLLTAPPLLLPQHLLTTGPSTQQRSCSGLQSCHAHQGQWVWLQLNLQV